MLLVGLKAWFSYKSGSVAILASLADSALDLISSLLILIAIVWSNRPADDGHRYGHGKGEALAGLAQAAAIFVSAIFIVVTGIGRLAQPRELSFVDESIAIMIVSMLLTGALISFQQYVIRHTGSQAVKADRLHYLVDLLTNVVVIVSLVLGSRFGLHWADPVTAMLLSAFILKGCWEVLSQSLDILMDKDVSNQFHGLLDSFVAEFGNEVKGYHDLRSRTTGEVAFIELHLEIRSSCSFQRSHELAELLTERLEESAEGLEVIVHTDPV